MFAFIRRLICSEYEVRALGTFLLWCDGTLSLGLTRGNAYSYGITVEPFVLTLSGADGDVAWQSGGRNLLHRWFH